jgi:hypothetical protein
MRRKTDLVRRCMVQCCCLAAALATVPGGLSAQTAEQPQVLRISAENSRLSHYLHELAGPGAFMSVIGGGLVEELWRKPTLGSDGADHLSSRMLSRAGQAAVQVSVRHGLAALMHRSTDYRPCECRGFGPRIEHALLETFTDRRADGSRALSVPRIAGAYAGDFARLAWDRNQSGSDAVLGATLSLGFTALFNVGRELTGIAR